MVSDKGMILFLCGVSVFGCCMGPRNSTRGPLQWMTETAGRRLCDDSWVKPQDDDDESQ